MSRPWRHHHVPVFYLRSWAANDGRIAIARNIGGRISWSRRPPKQTAYETDLYSYHETFDAPDPAEIETRFFQPLDDDAARVFRKAQSNETMSEAEVLTWVQFLLCLRVRSPRTVLWMKEHAAAELERHLETGQPEYALARKPEDPDLFVDWVKAHRPGLIESVGVGQIPHVGSDDRVMRGLRELTGYVVDFSSSRRPLLTSDNPCVFSSGLGDPDCIVALPLTPRLAYFGVRPGSHAERHLQAQRIDILARALNDHVTCQAIARVYAHDAADVANAFLAERLAESGGR